ncbi:hypothetical protein PVK06_021266 [Gossypium arboreum]|uniref:Uncharacterized protein n=1 Tax=Gossypium arboreum TaxID=29729 RepID=A0ABR0PPR9_GOSAR|nr:hypothetical protein PVK06_021266 [Gossypium arboreum]
MPPVFKSIPYCISASESSKLQRSLKPSILASEISLSQAQRDLHACQGSTLQQPKPRTESLTSKWLSTAAKHSRMVLATNLDENLPSNSVSFAPAATSEESMPVNTSNEGKFG